MANGEPVYNPQTKKFEFPKDGKVAETANVVYVPIDRATIDKLSTFGVQDGAKIDAETERGKGAQKSKIARLYILQAIEDFCSARASVKK